MRKKWTNRKLYTYQFRAREPRQLLWRKDVYREWFLYAQLGQKLRRKIPKAFGNLSKFNDFEDWWRDERYGFELFCELPIDTLVTEVKSNTSISSDEILIKINLKGDLDIINRDINKLLISKDVDSDYISTARFRPSRPMRNISVGVTKTEFDDEEKRQNKLAEYRNTYEVVMKNGGSFKAAAKELGWLEDVDFYLKRGLIDKVDTVNQYQKIVDNKVKKVKRHVDQVENIFVSIENNTFP